MLTRKRFFLPTLTLFCATLLWNIVVVILFYIFRFKGDFLEKIIEIIQYHKSKKLFRFSVPHQNVSCLSLRSNKCVECIFLFHTTLEKPIFLIVSLPYIPVYMLAVSSTAFVDTSQHVFVHYQCLEISVKSRPYTGDVIHCEGYMQEK